MLDDSAFEAQQETFFTDFCEDAIAWLERTVELDGSGRVSGFLEGSLNATNRLLVTTFRGEAVEAFASSSDNGRFVVVCQFWLHLGRFRR